MKQRKVSYKVRTSGQTSSRVEALSVTEEHETDPLPLEVRDRVIPVGTDCRRKWVSVKLIIEVFLKRTLLLKSSDVVSKLVSGKALMFAMTGFGLKTVRREETLISFCS